MYVGLKSAISMRFSLRKKFRIPPRFSRRYRLHLSFLVALGEYGLSVPTASLLRRLLSFNDRAVIADVQQCQLYGIRLPLQMACQLAQVKLAFFGIKAMEKG